MARSMSTPEPINPQDDDLLARALRLADDLDKLGDYLLALKADDARGKLQKEAADAIRELADHIALVAG
jgi:hypothetical protein